MIPPVVDRAWLARHPEAVLADVRYYLDGRSAAEAYAAGHIPGAVRVDMDAVLADPPSAEAGRHPLPAPERFAAGLAAAGIGDGATVVAYDDAGGAMAGRLVWLLRMLGEDAALLDGGLRTWNGELSAEAPEPPPARFSPRPWPKEALATIEEAATGECVIDARAGERYRGETEPIDPRAGHVPGALSAPFPGNLTAGPLPVFRPADELHERYAALGAAQRAPVVYCGSGVTACHDLLALHLAGFEGRLYTGSWSEWSSDPTLPAASGPHP